LVGQIGQKYSGVRRHAEQFAQRKAAVNQLAKKMLCRLWHKSTANPRAGQRAEELDPAKQIHTVQRKRVSGIPGEP
jgi:hypothetical protein